jgi:hypothetical protein
MYPPALVLHRLVDSEPIKHFLLKPKALVMPSSLVLVSEQFPRFFNSQGGHVILGEKLRVLFLTCGLNRLLR